jgi:hypothetical protein
VPKNEDFYEGGYLLRPVELEPGWYYPGILQKKRPSTVPEITEPLPDRETALASIHRAEARNRKLGRKATKGLFKRNHK